MVEKETTWFSCSALFARARSARFNVGPILESWTESRKELSLCSRVTQRQQVHSSVSTRTGQGAKDIEMTNPLIFISSLFIVHDHWIRLWGDFFFLLFFFLPLFLFFILPLPYALCRANTAHRSTHGNVASLLLRNVWREIPGSKRKANNSKDQISLETPGSRFLNHN